MANEGVIVATGIVTETLPNTTFRVKLKDTGQTPDQDKEILARIAGRMRKHYIKIVVGDEVDVEMSPYDLERGRIVYRYKDKKRK